VISPAGGKRNASRNSAARVSWQGDRGQNGAGITAETEGRVAERVIVYWRDIPAQVIIRQGRKTAKRELSPRFVQAIDACAMRVGAVETDAYLAEWRKGSPEPCSDDLEAEADTALARLESDYGRDRLRQLVDNGGREA
jgi:hypothetical protein